jgi:hypothetical protein
MSTIPQHSPAGWYPFDKDRGVRYWDGSQWVRPADYSDAPAETPGAGSYIVAVLFPVVGVVLAIIQFARGNVGPGLALLVTSGLSAVVWSIVLFGAAVDQATTDFDTYGRCIEDAQTLAHMDQC